MYTFRYVILPAVMNKMHSEFKRRLKAASFVTLITDCWISCSFSNIEFLGLGAQLIDTSFDKQLIIIGMVELVGGHNAENIQAIETIINKYKFDKNKIKGNSEFFAYLYLNLIN